MYDNFVDNRLKSIFETKLECMRITLDTLSSTDLEQNKNLMKFYRVLGNPVEQSICQGLILSMYGDMESCIMEIIECIENKTNIKYRDFSRKRKGNNLYKMRDYIEKYSSIRFNEHWCEEALYISIIRNTIIHNGSWLEEKDDKKREKLERYAILDYVVGVELITIAEDLKHLYNVLEAIENLLKGLLTRKIKIKE